jgi:tetratricopeptide (TPR) repeat protein
MKHQSLKFAALMLFAGAFSSVLAQKISAQPFPPLEDGKVTIKAEGFAANTNVNILFNAPKPTKLDGSSLPATVKTDAKGMFVLVLKSGSRLSMAARAGTQKAELKLEPPAPATMPVLTVKGDGLEASVNGNAVWTARLHPRAGVKLEPVVIGRDIFVPDGASVMQLEPDKGMVIQRFVVSGLVSSLDARGTDVRVNVDVPNGSSTLMETFTLRRLASQPNFSLLERPVYQPGTILLETFDGFAQKASQGNQLNPSFPDVSQQTNAQFAASDPTNPFYKIFEGAAWSALNQPEKAKMSFSQALNTTVPFFVYIREASMFERLKDAKEFSDRALLFARVAYGNAGYDPAIPISSKALEAYGNPLGVTRELLKGQFIQRATVWLSFLRDTMPRFDQSEIVFLEMANYLDVQSPGDAEFWRNAQRDIAQGTPYTFGVSRMVIFSLGTLLALIGAFVALWLVLAVKYSAQQSKDLKNVGGAMGAWGKAPLMRLRHSLSAYLTLTEKIVLVTLLALMVGALGTWAWSTRALETLRHPAFNLGTLGGVTFWNSFATKPTNLGFEAIRGLAFLLDGDKTRASQTLEKATNNPMALNNLGVLALERGDNARATQDFQAALLAQPQMLEASFNAHANTGSSYRLNFHKAVFGDAPMLAFPEPKDIVETSQGKLELEFVHMVSDSWGYLVNLPFGLPAWAMMAVAVLILAILLLNLLSLLIPRVRSARDAPRNVVYHFLALLVPGSGLADEVWGIILLVPWALAGGVLLIFFNRSDLVPSIFESHSILGISSVPAMLDLKTHAIWVIAGIALLYLINFVGWLLETLAWNKKMKHLAEVAAKQTSAGTVQTP